MLIEGCSGLTPAMFPLPDNPILRVFSPQTLAGMGDFVPASFPLPDNPILRATGLCGCGAPCGCSEGLCSCGRGMGDIGTSLSKMWSNVTTGGYSNYLLLGGAALVALMLLGGEGRQRRSELAAARAEYKAKVAAAKSRYRSSRHGIKYPVEV
jgi:hypothetical protein